MRGKQYIPTGFAQAITQDVPDWCSLRGSHSHRGFSPVVQRYHLIFSNRFDGLWAERLAAERTR
jgi:hypothetical protein